MKIVKKALIAALALTLVIGVLGACSSLLPQSKQLIGSWRDSTGMCGYEFKDDNTVVITYADWTIPIINIKYTGAVDGTYTTLKDDNDVNHVTITYTLFTKSITQEYTYSVDKSALTLTAADSGDVTVLIKQEPAAPTTAGQTTAAAQ